MAKESLYVHIYPIIPHIYHYIFLYSPIYPYIPLHIWLGNTLKYCCWTSIDKMYLFGFEIQSFEECMPKPETSGRYLSFGGDEASSEVHIWRKNRDTAWHYNILTVLDKNLAQNRDWAKWPPPKCRSRSEVSFGSLNTLKYRFLDKTIYDFTVRPIQIIL